MRLFLRAGEQVKHNRYLQWGVGIVEEVMTSNVPGGTCLARIRFQDGRLRVFHNDLDNQSCCYYFGIRHYDDPGHNERPPPAPGVPRFRRLLKIQDVYRSPPSR